MKNAFLGIEDIDPLLGFGAMGREHTGSGPSESSDDPFYSVLNGAIYGTYIPAGYDNTTPSSGSDPSQAVAVTSGGLTINVIYTSAALSAPQSFRDGIQQAVAIMAAAFSDKITVNITVNWSGTGGGASAGPTSGLYEPYTWVRSNLINNASPGDTSFNALPTGTSIQGQANVAVWNAQLKLWGALGANDTTTSDGSANFATDINPNLLVGVALHELTHAMGRIPYGSAPDIFDLFRFTSVGTRLFQGGATAPAAYFSLDGGNTKIADYGRTSDASDFLNSGVQGPNDPFNEFYNGSTAQQLTSVDLKQLVALGFHLASAAKPNLSDQVFLGSTTIAAGGSVTADTFVANYASGAAGASTSRIYLSTDATITTSDVVLATVNSGSLAAVGQAGYYDHQTLSLALPANLAAGTYYIGGIADYANLIGETDETDNTYNVTKITVTSTTAAKPNLSEQVFLGSTTIAAGGTVSADTFIVNYANVAAGASTSRIYLSTDATITTSDAVLATVNSGSLAAVGQAGSSDHQTLSLTLPANLAAGTYYIGGIADYANLISETDETDNTYNVTKITVTSTAAQPNLSEQVFLGSTTIAAGGSVSADTFVVNYANVAAGASTSRIYLSTDATITNSDVVLATVNSGTLAAVGQAGYYDHQTLSLALPANLAAGTYYIGGIADYANLISETNETDNTYNVTKITVTSTAAQPNLSEQVFLGSTTIAAGGTVSADTFIVNYANVAAGASTSRIYLSTDATITTSDVVLATVNSGSLAAVGQAGYYDHKTLSLTLPANLSAGTYYIGGIADYANLINETNEADNTYNVARITVTSAGVQLGPDLQVQPAATQPLPQDALAAVLKLAGLERIADSFAFRDTVWGISAGGEAAEAGLDLFLTQFGLAGQPGTNLAGTHEASSPEQVLGGLGSQDRLAHDDVNPFDAAMLWHSGQFFIH